MRKILITSLLLLFIFCGCSFKTVNVVGNGFSSLISAKYGQNNFCYKINYITDGDCSCLACPKTPPIDYFWENERLRLTSGEISINLKEKCVNYSVPAMVKNVLDEAAGTKITADYNGMYQYHGTGKYGEYTLTLVNSGMPQKIVFKNNNLTVHFSNLSQKEV